MLARIREAEAQAEEIRQGALLQARNLVRDAQEDAQIQADLIIRQARANARETQVQAEDRAALATDRKMKEQQAADEDFKTQAMAKMDQVVACVMGRIVS
jgi:F0F1-type ATP synthase membrane subunit b/b'